MKLRLWIVIVFSISFIQGQSFRGVSQNQWFWAIGGSHSSLLIINKETRKVDTLCWGCLGKKDFRDLDLEYSRVYAMSSGNGGYIYKFGLGSNEFETVLADTNSLVFFDAIDVKARGLYFVVVGDPQLGANSLYYFDIRIAQRSLENKDSWKFVKWNNSLRSMPGEAMFAGSGTNVFCNNFSLSHSFFITGGASGSRLVRLDSTYSFIPMAKGLTAGAYSMFVNQKDKYETKKTTIYVCGGDYTNPNAADSVFAYSNDNGKTWKRSKKGPTGYRSCIAGSKKSKILVCCGTNGTDISFNKGKTWSKLNNKNYNVCMFDESSLLLAGIKGQWELIEIKELKKIAKKSSNHL